MERLHNLARVQLEERAQRAAWKRRSACLNPYRTIIRSAIHPATSRLLDYSSVNHCRQSRPRNATITRRCSEIPACVRRIASARPSLKSAYALTGARHRTLLKIRVCAGSGSVSRETSQSCPPLIRTTHNHHRRLKARTRQAHQPFHVKHRAVAASWRAAVTGRAFREREQVASHDPSLHLFLPKVRSVDALQLLEVQQANGESCLRVERAFSVWCCASRSSRCGCYRRRASDLSIRGCTCMPFEDHPGSAASTVAIGSIR